MKSQGEDDGISLRVLAAWRLCVRIVFEPIDNARDTVFDEGHLEVDEQAKALVGEPEIGQELLFVDGSDQLDGFDFYDDLTFYDQIGPPGTWRLVGQLRSSRAHRGSASDQGDGFRHRDSAPER